MEMLEDEFSELYLKYDLAMNELETKLNNILKTYKYYYPKDEIIDHTKSRIKNMDSARKKLNRKGYDFTPENVNNHLHDMVGFRIVCPFLNDVYKVIELIKSTTSFNIENENDYISNPKDSGYSSYHIDVSIPIEFNNEIINISGEIQVRTMAMDLWATLDHKIRYKISDDIQNELSSEFLARAQDISRFDHRMQYLKDEVRELRKEEKEKPKMFVKEK